jgi:hypothetical protein
MAAQPCVVWGRSATEDIGILRRPTQIHRVNRGKLSLRFSFHFAARACLKDPISASSGRKQRSSGLSVKTGKLKTCIRSVYSPLVHGPRRSRSIATSPLGAESTASHIKAGDQFGRLRLSCSHGGGFHETRVILRVGPGGIGRRAADRCSYQNFSCDISL